MNWRGLIAALALIPILSLSSCKGGAAKKADAPAAEKSGPGDAAATVKKRTPAEFLASIPCKLDQKKGVFAVFPGNPAAGQVCFILSPMPGEGGNVMKFDIQASGMRIVFHDADNAKPPEGVKLVRWEERAGQPCLDAACGKEIAASSETYSAPDNPGWTYVIFTPNDGLDLASSPGGYYGLVMNDAKFLPLFH